MKNKYIYNYTLLTGMLLIGISSCKKYLDKKSNNSFVVPTTLDDAQSFLDDAGFINSATPSFGEASSDDYFLLPATYNGLANSPRNQKVYLWIPEEYNFDNDWARQYRPVYSANLCLEIIDKIAVTAANESKWNNVKGSALFYRAWSFLNLIWIYGKAYDENTSSTDLGIVLRLVSDFNTPSVRASVKQTYERIIADAKEAIPYLPNTPIHTYRPSKAATYGLLARAYLSMRNYDSSLKYADLCLGINSQLMNYNGDVGVNVITSTAPFARFNKETIFFSDMNTILNGLISASAAKADTVLYASYNTNDLRRTAFFRQVSGYPSFKGFYSSSGFYFTGIATDEMFLTRAESYAHIGNKDSALADLNRLMIKRWSNLVPYPTITAVDANDALNKVRIERRKELLMRGLRWIDIKRLNKENAAITPTRIVNSQTYTLQPNANYYALPLPKDILDLTGIPQNPL